MNNKKFTKELDEVLTYMTDILGKEFPTDVFTPEYLITSILDNKKSHANIILDNFLMSKNIEELKKIYISWLETNKKDIIFEKDKKIFNFSQELDNILTECEHEKDKMKSSIIGTEHLLLAMLNQDNNHTKIIEIFKNIGVFYNFIFDKCIESKKNIPNEKKSNLLNIPKSQNLLIKSDNHTSKKIISNKSEYISKYTTNLNELAMKKQIDDLIGREKELRQIFKILARRKVNNVVLVGEGGCGKTQIVNGIANMIVNNQVPEFLKNKEIVKLNVMALVSGTHFRGMFEERVNGLFEELKNDSKYILFIDDMQSILKNGSKDKDTDLSSMIDTVLSEGDVRVIGTCNFKDYHNAIETNTSISRKLQKIVIEPTNVDETINIIKNIKSKYEEFHNVSYDDDVIKLCVELSNRYITTKKLPDSAIDVIDLSGANISLNRQEPDEIKNIKKALNEIITKKDEFVNNGKFDEVNNLIEQENKLNKDLAEAVRNYEKNKEKYKVKITCNDITNSISDITNIPVSKLSVDEKEKLCNIEETLKESIIGQDDAIKSICKIIKRNRVGLGDKTKTMGNVLMLGPSGCGKCVCGNTKIRIRNKKTLEIEEITIQDFYNKIKN